MSFPVFRPRRLRKKESLRKLVRETHLSPDDFIYPVFVVPGNNVKKEISALPGQYYLSVDRLVEEAKEVFSLGIPALLLFGVEDKKSLDLSNAYSSDGLVQRGVAAIKEYLPEITLITDVCCCNFTPHGHCGIVKNGEIDNDSSISLLSKIALSHARAGVDFVAPSAMMDGQVKAIRDTLDSQGFESVGIMAYSVKYCSSFYGPFREAAGSFPQFGNRSSYQMDEANRREALREVILDIEEGADIVMVKPALSYLDVISYLREKVTLPLAAYNVSGEYAMIKAASERGWLEEKRAVLEIITGIKRAGADIIITYFAKEVAKWLTT